MVLLDNRVVMHTGGELEDDANLVLMVKRFLLVIYQSRVMELDNVNIEERTTVAGNIDANDLDVDGHTNLDNLSVAGVTTFTGTSGSVVLFIIFLDLDVETHC